VSHHALPRSGRIAKRAIDLMFGLCALGPAMVLIAVNTLYHRLRYGQPGLLLQPRRGYQGRVYRLYKLRTMDTRLGQGSLCTERADPRVTPLGHFWRRWALDELPQAINVLRGDMSLVGPRPLQIEVDEQMTAAEPRWTSRYRVRPGLVSLHKARINNRDMPDVSWLVRCLAALTHDEEYINRWSWRLEREAIFGSLRMILRGHDLGSMPPVSQYRSN
jgi:lipopolysaccharide/colanic/teichoic acid biosynthesis glycosyltransferase